MATSAAQTDFASAVCAPLASRLGPLGFECHPFLVGWYNERVGPKFKLPYGDDTAAVVVLSRPDMFELTFVPVSVHNSNSIRFPGHYCMESVFPNVN